MTKARPRRLWRAVALAALLCVGFVGPHAAGHDDARAAGAAAALAAAAADAADAAPAGCLLCLASAKLRVLRARTAALALTIRSAAHPIPQRAAERAPREVGSDPAAPRAPPRA